MAGCVGLFPIYRHSLVVKQVAAQFDLCRAHRIICWDFRARKTLGQIPIEIGAQETNCDGESDGDAFKQPSTRYRMCHIQPELPAYGARWRAAKHRGMP